MKFVYTENEKRHIFESETGHMSTFLKERVTKEQAETLFLAQLANEGITAPEVEQTPVELPNLEVTSPETVTSGTAPTVDPTVTTSSENTVQDATPVVEPALADITPTDTTNA